MFGQRPLPLAPGDCLGDRRANSQLLPSLRESQGVIETSFPTSRRERLALQGVNVPPNLPNLWSPELIESFPQRYEVTIIIPFH